MSPIAESSRRRFGHLSLALVLLAGGAVTDAAATGRICTSDDTLIFGNRAIGSSTMANATVTNCGDAPWSFTDVSVHPATGPAFHVSTTCTTGLALAPGATCTVSVGDLLEFDGVVAEEGDIARARLSLRRAPNPLFESAQLRFVT